MDKYICMFVDGKQIYANVMKKFGINIKYLFTKPWFKDLRNVNLSYLNLIRCNFGSDI